MDAKYSVSYIWFSFVFTTIFFITMKETSQCTVTTKSIFIFLWLILLPVFLQRICFYNKWNQVRMHVAYKAFWIFPITLSFYFISPWCMDLVSSINTILVLLILLHLCDFIFMWYLFSFTSWPLWIWVYGRYVSFLSTVTFSILVSKNVNDYLIWRSSKCCF